MEKKNVSTRNLIYRVNRLSHAVDEAISQVSLLEEKLKQVMNPSYFNTKSGICNNEEDEELSPICDSIQNIENHISDSLTSRISRIISHLEIDTE